MEIPPGHGLYALAGVLLVITAPFGLGFIVMAVVDGWAWIIDRLT